MRVRAGSGAGLALAVFAYPLAVNLFTGGPPKMWGWVKAKWVNQPWAGAGRGQGPSSVAGAGNAVDSPGSGIGHRG